LVYAVPSVIIDLAVEPISGGHKFSWSSQSSSSGPGTAYDVFSGALADLRSLGEFSLGSCLQDDVPSPFFDHLAADPPPGEGQYFIVRGQNDCPAGTGSFGNANRDTTAGSSAEACN
jgi:hypothetical protein